MSRVLFSNVSKSYGNVSVVKDFNFEIADGSFCSFLGPSGCGKTTCLRMVSGLEKNTSGQIFIDDELVNDPAKKIFVPPEKRNIGMVFQSYAVWPHMNVFDNIAYPLKIKKIKNEEIRERVLKIINLVELNGLEKRMPNQLSGGQQQRVALARGLVMEPRVLLLDEPLSNLDAKLREKMRKDIRAIQKSLKLTVLFVTHDQVEAFSMSDSIAIMNGGKIVQMGSPDVIKHNPNCEFVKDFITSS